MSYRGVGVPRVYAARAGVVYLPDGRHALCAAEGWVSVDGVQIGRVRRVMPRSGKPYWRGHSERSGPLVERYSTRGSVVQTLARIWEAGA